jgi:Protein of unknown function (DUF3307)
MQRERDHGSVTQLLLHLWGDYILQSDWMAQNKTRSWFPAFVHALLYSVIFTLLRPSLTAWLVIFSTHLVIDRYRLARFVVMAKNWFLSPLIARIEDYNTPTGYPESSPAWLAVWLTIIADNVLHLTINSLALQYL